MKTASQLAKHLRDVYTGGNWTAVNLKDTLADVSWQQAPMKVHGFNSIAVLVYHMHYYIAAVTKVLQGYPLQASDKFSFDAPEIHAQQDWEQLIEKSFRDAETFASLIEQLPDEKLAEPFEDGKYGTYYRNLAGIIEHTHYHLGQIVLIKKLLQQA